MGRTLGMACLTAGLLAIFPAALAAQKKPLDVAEAATDQEYKWLQSIKDMTGKIASVNTMSITFRLDIPHLEPNPKYRAPKGSSAQHQQLHRIYSLQNQIMLNRNPIQRQIKMQQLMASLGA